VALTLGIESAERMRQVEAKEKKLPASDGMTRWIKDMTKKNKATREAIEKLLINAGETLDTMSMVTAKRIINLYKANKLVEEAAKLNSAG